MEPAEIILYNFMAIYAATMGLGMAIGFCLSYRDFKKQLRKYEKLGKLETKLAK